jgi:hypothetical protein
VALGAAAPPTDERGAGGIGDANIPKWLLWIEVDNDILGVAVRGAKLGDDKWEMADTLFIPPLEIVLELIRDVKCMSWR